MRRRASGSLTRIRRRLTSTTPSNSATQGCSGARQEQTDIPRKRARNYVENVLRSGYGNTSEPVDSLGADVEGGKSSGVWYER